MKKPIKHLIFDFDGTLIDASLGILAGFHFALRSPIPVTAIIEKRAARPLRQALGTIFGSRVPEWLDRLACLSFERTQTTYRDKGKMLAPPLVEQAVAALSAAHIGDKAEDGEAADRNMLKCNAAQLGYFLPLSPTHCLTVLNSPAEPPG